MRVTDVSHLLFELGVALLIESWSRGADNAQV